MDNKERARRAEIVILFGEVQVGARMALRQTLLREGFEKIWDFQSLMELEEHLNAAFPDLVFIDTLLGQETTDLTRAMPSDGGKVSEIIRAIRHGEVGANPFVPVVATTWDPSSALVNDILNAGADDLLVKPLSGATMMDRINALIQRRKNFVVTSDYIGPDRRRDTPRQEMTGAMQVPLLSPPNPLATKMKGDGVSLAALRSQINEMKHQVNEQRLKRSAFQAAFLTIEILAAAKNSNAAALRENSQRLCAVAHDLLGRIAGSSIENGRALCSRLKEASTAVATGGKNPDAHQLSALDATCRDVAEAFHPELSSGELRAQVLDAVNRVTARRQQQPA
jgi:DNA-binding response OmpR family regulator